MMTYLPQSNAMITKKNLQLQYDNNNNKYGGTKAKVRK